MQLLNKRALLAGAATGIGRATALHFAREGASVVIGISTQMKANEPPPR